jgi:superfamily II DNA or RNA helicase
MTQSEVQASLIDAAMKSMDAYGRLRCTIEAITGLGKTFISFQIIKMLQPKSVLFLAETTMREQNIMEDMEKFKSMFNYDIKAHHKIHFACYQSVYKQVGTYYDMVVADEIHDSLTPKYYNYYLNNKYTHLLGLSATIDKKTKYQDEVGNEYTKIDMLNNIAPIAATYTIQDGQNDNTSRKLKLIIIEHQLDNSMKSIATKFTKNGQQHTFMQTEQQAYNYADMRLRESLFSRNRNEFLIRYWSNVRNNLLYSLPSKTRSVIKLLTINNLQRNIIFGNNIEELSKICPTVSSKNSAITNKILIKEFNAGNIDTIGSFKMLKQGVNLTGLNNVIFHSYYSIEKDFIQRVGRLRKSEDVGNVFIFVTRNTQEEVWFSKMTENVNIDFVRFKNVESCITV